MRKILFLLVALLMLLVAFPVSATPVDQLSDLARYYPANTPLFVTVRIDDEFIGKLDTVAQNIDSKLGGMLGGMDAHSGLDMLATQIDPKADFKTVFGWLGDTAAMGVMDSQNLFSGSNFQENMTLAVAVADSRGAELFLDNLIGAAYDKTDTNDGAILYSPLKPNTDTPVFYLANDVLLMNFNAFSPEGIVPQFDTSLADKQEFQDAMARLPLDDYDAVAYLDPAIYLSLIDQYQTQMNTMPMNLDSIKQLINAASPISEGISIRDGRNLLIDVAVDFSNMDSAQLALMQNSMNREPIDLAFLNNVPANTALFVQSTGFGPEVIAAINALEAMGNQYDDMYAAGNLPPGAENLRQMDAVAVFIRQSFEGLTGLTLDQAFGSLTGNYLAYLNILPNDNPDIPVLPDFGMLVDTSGSDTSALLSALPNMLHDLGVDYTEENGMIVVPLLSDMLQNSNMDILIGEKDGLLISGTRAGIEAMGGDSIADSKAFQNASQYFVEDTQMLVYLNFAPLSDLVNTLAQNGNSDMQQLAMILPLFESASITSHSDKAGAGHARFVITLAQ